MDDRYQHQSFWVQRLRDLWLLTVPYWAIRSWLRECLRHYPNAFGTRRLTFKQCWSVSRGMCDLRRRWVYTGAELDEASYKITFTKSAGLIWVRVASNPNWIGVGNSRRGALKSLRESVDLSGGVFNLRTHLLSKRIHFSETGKL
jgi:hypothetical protein